MLNCKNFNTVARSPSVSSLVQQSHREYQEGNIMEAAVEGRKREGFNVHDKVKRH